jgi:hypothetical protein
MKSLRQLPGITVGFGSPEPKDSHIHNRSSAAVVRHAEHTGLTPESWWASRKRKTRKSIWVCSSVDRAGRWVLAGAAGG